MALVVCCPCGNPLDCDNLEIVVTLTCPKCNREIPLELETDQPTTTRGVLTVMEGPHWVGEQFIIPIAMDLTIGTVSGNWLSLESANLGETHCRLYMDAQGRLMVEDLGNPSGTWIAEQRVLRGRLQPRQSLRVGEFRFRFDLQSSEGSTVAPTTAQAVEAAVKALPTMERVSPRETPGTFLVHNRYPVCRFFMISFAWLMGVFHLCHFVVYPASVWPWAHALIVATGMVMALVISGRKVTLAHRHYKYFSLGVLLTLAILDANWAVTPPVVAGATPAVVAGPMAGAAAGFAPAAVAGFVLMILLSLMIIRTPTESMAITSGLLGLAGVTTMAVATIGILQPFIARYY